MEEVEAHDGELGGARGELHRRLEETRGMRRGLGFGPIGRVWVSLQNLQGVTQKIEAAHEFSLLHV